MRETNKILRNKIILTFLIILGIILVFALIDFFMHKLSSEYDVPSYYFRNKIIFGAIIGLFVYWFMKKQKLWIKSLVFSAVISILLQVRYYIEGYPRGFVFLFLGIHFVILLVVSWSGFKIAEKYI